MQNNQNYIVATVKDWNVQEFYNKTPSLPGNWYLITKKEDLNLEKIKSIDPRYIFFPHWSWKVPTEIFERWECVCFHMTDLPYGRGGSPLQNLIQLGHSETKLTALKMTNELDAGPIYGKVDISLDGRAEDIFRQVAKKVYDLIKTIIQHNPMPEQQTGHITTFKRRSPEDSLLPYNGNLKTLYNHIRMLDAKSYPKAFLIHGSYYVEFAEVSLEEGTEELTAKVRITKNTREENNKND